LLFQQQPKMMLFESIKIQASFAIQQRDFLNLRLMNQWREKLNNPEVDIPYLFVKSCIASATLR